MNYLFQLQLLKTSSAKVIIEYVHGTYVGRSVHVGFHYGNTILEFLIFNRPIIKKKYFQKSQFEISATMSLKKVTEVSA